MADLLDVAGLQRWCRLLSDALGRAQAELNELNVFPVPDGDTGTNLHKTVVATAEAVGRLPVGTDPATAWRALADGALAGAHGNSGVILSQILRGMADILGHGGELEDALRHASLMAYEAVSHPVEGTMLSVLRAAAGTGTKSGDPATAARKIAQRARIALGKTTAQLDVLARSGVVDAGGAGLCLVLDTLAAVICDEVPYNYATQRAGWPENFAPSGQQLSPVHTSGSYEVVYLIYTNEADAARLRAGLNQIGHSVIMAGEDGLMNVHVHTDDAGAAIEAGIRIGNPYTIRVRYIDQSRQ
jgi:dihydroxyacetone kinase-like predicted kinase